MSAAMANTALPGVITTARSCEQHRASATQRARAFRGVLQAIAPGKSGDSTALPDRVQRACRSKALVALKEARAHIVCFREAVDQSTPPALNAAMESSASSSKSAASQKSLSSIRGLAFGRT